MAQQELFTNNPTKVNDLLQGILSGRTGLPDLQRPFVWSDSKVRDLFDSMMKGYPIGYVMLWVSPENYENKISTIGAEPKDGRRFINPEELIIDGQQRLTALLAAIAGVEIKDKDYSIRHIKISYNPLTREFAVWDNAKEKDAEWINQICDVFKAKENSNIPALRKTYIEGVNKKRERNGLPPLTDEEENKVEENITALTDLLEYTLPTVKIKGSASEEDVSDIFVRTNSGGQKLNEKNFIQTLLAVYDNDIYNRIEKFCEESRNPKKGTSFNNVIDVEQSHLIRVAVGFGFRRARLKYAYMLLRGKDLETGEITAETRNKNIEIFRNALDCAMNINDWHAFLNLFAQVGYLDKSFIGSTNAVVFSYVLYLIAKYDYKVPSAELQSIMKKWIFMSLNTLFYTSSTETTVEKQFADLRDIKDANGFIAYLQETIDLNFSDEYFKNQLVKNLETSSSNSPAWFSYIAAINILNKPMFLGNTTLAQYLTPGAIGDKNPVDKHHIFPKHYLENIGITDDRERNQIANFTYLDYQTNIDIGDDEPSIYIDDYRKKLGADKVAETCSDNAIPVNFEKLEYHDFLQERRKLMSRIIKKAYETLA